MPPPKTGIVPAFAGAARALAPRIRSALASTCRAAPILARSLVQNPIKKLRGRATTRHGDVAAAAATGLRGTTSSAATSASSNPLLASADFPLYDQVIFRVFLSFL